ncbi:MAG: hypothetical protein PHD02_04070 [Bacilli bacterium]|nr:hypothetical protein [Bacilli bacterium]
MYKESIRLLQLLDKAGYKSYIVGGFVRDFLLQKESIDVDICTTAHPKDLKKILNVNINNSKYGSVTYRKDNIRFEITTMRKEIGYINHRTPKKIKYIKSLYKDLKRRDFTINTICIDKNEKIIDLLDAKKDLNDGIIKMIGNPRKRLNEDALRILRAIRFATTLNFKLDDKLEKYIKKYGFLLKNLSFDRKKEELNKIFMSKNINYGIKIIKDLNLEKFLDIDLTDTKPTSTLIGFWAQCDKKRVYNYNKNDLNTLKNIDKILSNDIINNYTLYNYNLYEVLIAAEIKELNAKKIIQKYSDLPIKSTKDIKISSQEILNLLNKKPGKFLKQIIGDLEINILNFNLDNDYNSLKDYIIANYS